MEPTELELNGVKMLIVPDWAMDVHYLNRERNHRMKSGEYIVGIRDRQDLFNAAGFTSENKCVFDWAYPIEWAAQQHWWMNNRDGEYNLVWCYKPPENLNCECEDLLTGGSSDIQRCALCGMMYQGSKNERVGPSCSYPLYDKYVMKHLEKLIVAELQSRYRESIGR